MKKSGILNSSIAKAIADLGHMDLIAIGDCGLPIDSSKKIDLALKLGSPSFIEVLDELLKDFSVEGYTLACEIKEKNPKVLSEVEDLLEGVESNFISHENFKKKLEDCKFVIRTGENTPYANIILRSKNIF